MTKVHDISSYKISSSDEFFFDNNIWMFLFCPIANFQKDRKQKHYSNFFKQVLSSRACVWINSLILSEFCNAWLRIEYNKWRRKPENSYALDYKRDFVKSEMYNEAIEEITTTLPQILNQAERCSDNFNAINLDSVYNELKNCDFNDSYYLELAQLNNWKIVTDDADLFENNQTNIEIITANIR